MAKKASSTVFTNPKKYSSLGESLRIGSKSLAIHNAAGASIEYNVPSVMVTVNIGKTHSAQLIMSEAALKALNGGEKINITTLNEFKLGMK